MSEGGERVIRAALLALGFTMAAGAQSAPAQPKFEVASVKPSRPGEQASSNFPLGPGDVYVRNGGYLSAQGFPLSVYLMFAYKMIGNQAQYVLPRLPDWTKNEPYDIEARAESDPGKDGMRLAMRALLADRFGLETHYEEREVPLLGFALAHSGKTGPQLQAHMEGSACPTEARQGSSGVVDGKPALCNGIFPLPASVPGRLRFGGRNVTMSFIADTFSGALGRPMVDRTGLRGTFDFTLEFMQERNGAAPPGTETQVDDPGPTFEEALREQLGIKLQSIKGPMKVLVVDRVRRPSAN